ncbi:MAG TPA: histidine phosphatase family protein [Pirellulales bacterium]|jgi:probable phosphoglycerate mutase|nr:histidine phosphatase family protein [Pirellulales bacterium]
MLNIVLVRPGCTDYDRQGRIQGTLDIPLCEQGRLEIDKVAESLRAAGLEIIYCAPCESARESAELLGRMLNVRVKPLEKLRNLDHGLWQGMLVEDVRTRQPRVYRQWQEHPETVCPPSGELVGDAQQRVQAALAKLVRKHADGKIAVVAPEPLAGIIKAELLHRDLGDMWEGLSGGARCEWLEVGTPLSA